VIEAIDELRRQEGLCFRPHLRNKVPADKGRWHGKFMLPAGIVYAHLLEFLCVCHPIPREVVATMARLQLVVRSGDRVAQNLQLLSEEEAEVGKDGSSSVWREVGFIGRASPEVIAGIDWLDLRGKLRTHAGANAVASNQQIGTLGVAVRKTNMNTAAVLLDVL
jgi:hypothetical protein